jgi:methyl-accepting chemotaxis protein
MLRKNAVAKPRAQWGLPISAGAIGLAMAVAGLTMLGLNDAFAVNMSIILVLNALAVGALITVIQERRSNRAARIALDSMTLGLSMFDNAARLVLCNARYVEMSKLPPEYFQQGTPLRELLVRRAQAGSFAGDPDKYVLDALQQAAGGQIKTQTFELEDGRTISLVSRPLAGGGWLSTHTDVTQQRMAERERDSLRQSEKNRTVVDKAIADFRARVESVLLTVADSAVAMKTAATALLTTSDQTIQRTESALRSSNEASANAETTAIAAEELSASITEISGQLARANEVVRNAAADATATDADITALSKVTQRIGDVVKLTGHR